jgi:hypothetical protein
MCTTSVLSLLHIHVLRNFTLLIEMRAKLVSTPAPFEVEKNRSYPVLVWSNQ